MKVREGGEFELKSALIEAWKTQSTQANVIKASFSRDK